MAWQNISGQLTLAQRGHDQVLGVELRQEQELLQILVGCPPAMWHLLHRERYSNAITTQLRSFNSSQNVGE